jgi:hypothetical protein
MLIALAAAVTPLAFQEPAELHPSDAVFVVQVPNVPDLRVAYGTTALALMLGDDEIHTAIGDLMRVPPLDPLALALDQYEMAVESGDMPPVLDYLSGIQSVSLSITVEGGDFLAFTKAVDDVDDEEAFLARALGIRLVVDFVDETAAELVFGFLAEALENDPPPGAQIRTRAITAPNGGGGFGSDRLTVRSPVPASADSHLNEYIRSVNFVTGGKRLVVLAGDVELEAAIAAMVNGRGEDSAVALFAPGRAAFGSAAGVPMVELYMQPVLERVLAEEAPQALPLLDLAEGLFGPLASMVIRGGHWRIGIDEGQFVTQGLAEPGAAGPMSGLIGAKPLSASALTLVHPDALVTSVTSLDTAVLAKTIEMLAAEAGEGTLDQLEEAYGFRPERDIAGALGDAIAYSLTPLRSLIAAPNLMGAAALDDREAFIRGMDGLFALAGDLGGDVQVNRSEYRGSMVYTVSFTGMFDGMGMDFLPIDPASFFKPTITVMTDRVLVTTIPTHAKKEIRRVAKLLKNEEAPGIHKGITAMGVPDGATTVGYADWPVFFGNLYTQLKSLAPMIAQMAGEDLPVDVAALPDAELLTRHFKPSERWTRRADGRVQHYARSSIGPETLMFPLAAAGIALPRAMSVQSFEEPQWAEAELIEVEAVSAPVPVEPGELALGRTQDLLVEISVAIRLYQLDHKGANPTSLAELLEKTETYPDGYLEGGAVPQDGWGQAFVFESTAAGYALRSIGPDGKDEKGAGDDLTLQ